MSRANGIWKYYMFVDVAMGLLFIGLSIYILINKKFGNFPLTGPAVYLMMGLLIVYGAFRIYRGISAFQAEARGDNDDD